MEEQTNDDHLVDWYARDYEPDDPDEIEKEQAARFRGTEKAALIRDLLRQGKTPAQIKLYAPGILRKREQDGIEKVREAGQGRKRRILGRPMGKRHPRGRGR